jgi:hypothetical protein
LTLHFIPVERLVPVLVLSKIYVTDDLANFDLIPYDETNWHLEDTTKCRVNMEKKVSVL